LMKLLNIASRSLDGWSDRAYARNEPVRPYFGSEGDVLDWGDPDSGADDPGNMDDDEYADGVNFDDIEDIDDIDDDEGSLYAGDYE
jgi:hypothetical protein